MTNIGAPISRAAYAGAHFVVADGDGQVHFCASDGEVLSFRAHEGAVLDMATHRKSGTVYTAGDDGRAVSIVLDGEATQIYGGNKWVDTIACSPRGPVAWSVAKTIMIKPKPDADVIVVDAPSTVSDLSFSDDGRWLGAAVYGGALLMPSSDPGKTKMLSWQGSHQKIAFSPDGRFCVTSMLENALHVWLIGNGEVRDGRMGGYPSKPQSFAWSADGRMMATAGANMLVGWPFSGADGPLGQSASVFDGESDGPLLRTVASRPQSQQFAIGYVNGGVAIFDRKDGVLHSICGPGDIISPVIALDFSDNGKQLGFARDDGTVGLALLS